MKLVTIVGARPQFIKAATISRAIIDYNTRKKATKARSPNDRNHGYLHEMLLHTGQHYDQKMSQVFFDELHIPEPDVNLGIGGGTHGQNTGRMIEAIEAVLIDETPDWVIVYGDTDSTLAGTIAAVKLHIPIAHVEAGLRSYNRTMPEEINRVLTDHAADLLFAPTTVAVDNLRNEGVDERRIRQVGDVMYDAALFYASEAEEKSQILDQLGLTPKSFVLGTVHRAENVDDPKKLTTIMEAFNGIACDYPVIVPLHPRTQKKLTSFDFTANPSLRMIQPVGYLDMVMLEKNAKLIATDSGGVQKEAFFQRVPCVTLRQETEWSELLDLGWNRLADPTSLDQLMGAMRSAMTSRPPHAEQPYGNGDSAITIVDILSRQSLDPVEPA